MNTKQYISTQPHSLSIFIFSDKIVSKLWQNKHGETWPFYEKVMETRERKKCKFVHFKGCSFIKKKHPIHKENAASVISGMQLAENDAMRAVFRGAQVQIAISWREKRFSRLRLNCRRPVRKHCQSNALYPQASPVKWLTFVCKPTKIFKISDRKKEETA